MAAIAVLPWASHTGRADATAPAAANERPPNARLNRWITPSYWTWQLNYVIRELPCSIKFNTFSICPFSLCEYVRKWEFVRMVSVAEKQLQVQLLQRVSVFPEGNLCWTKHKSTPQRRKQAHAMTRRVYLKDLISSPKPAISGCCPFFINFVDHDGILREERAASVPPSTPRPCAGGAGPGHSPSMALRREGTAHEEKMHSHRYVDTSKSFR